MVPIMKWCLHWRRQDSNPCPLKHGTSSLITWPQVFSNFEILKQEVFVIDGQEQYLGMDKERGFKRIWGEWGVKVFNWVFESSLKSLHCGCLTVTRYIHFPCGLLTFLFFFYFFFFYLFFLNCGLLISSSSQPEKPTVRNTQSRVSKKSNKNVRGKNVEKKIRNIEESIFWLLKISLLQRLVNPNWHLEIMWPNLINNNSLKANVLYFW